MEIILIFIDFVLTRVTMVKPGEVDLGVSFFVSYFKIDDNHVCSVQRWCSCCCRFPNHNRVLYWFVYFPFKRWIANRVTDKLTPLHDRIFCCRSGSAADTQAIADIVKYYLQIYT